MSLAQATQNISEHPGATAVNAPTVKENKDADIARKLKLYGVSSSVSLPPPSLCLILLPSLTDSSPSHFLFSVPLGRQSSPSWLPSIQCSTRLLPRLPREAFPRRPCKALGGRKDPHRGFEGRDGDVQGDDQAEERGRDHPGFHRRNERGECPLLLLFSRLPSFVNTPPPPPPFSHDALGFDL